MPGLYADYAWHAPCLHVPTRIPGSRIVPVAAPMRRVVGGQVWPTLGPPLAHPWPRRGPGAAQAWSGPLPGEMF